MNDRRLYLDHLQIQNIKAIGRCATADCAKSMQEINRIEMCNKVNSTESRLEDLVMNAMVKKMTEIRLASKELIELADIYEDTVQDSGCIEEEFEKEEVLRPVSYEGISFLNGYLVNDQYALGAEITD